MPDGEGLGEEGAVRVPVQVDRVDLQRIEDVGQIVCRVRGAVEVGGGPQLPPAAPHGLHPAVVVGEPQILQRAAVDRLGCSCPAQVDEEQVVERQHRPEQPEVGAARRRRRVPGPAFDRHDRLARRRRRVGVRVTLVADADGPGRGICAVQRHLDGPAEGGVARATWMFGRRAVASSGDGTAATGATASASANATTVADVLPTVRPPPPFGRHMVSRPFANGSPGPAGRFAENHTMDTMSPRGAGSPTDPTRARTSRVEPSAPRTPDVAPPATGARPGRGGAPRGDAGAGASRSVRRALVATRSVRARVARGLIADRRAVRMTLLRGTSTW